MPETPGIYIHPIHAVFPFADLTRPNITVTRFLELFDTVDPIDRDALIGLTAFALGVRAEDVDDEEDMAVAAVEEEAGPVLTDDVCAAAEKENKRRNAVS